MLSDLGDIGYTAQPVIIPAASVGAPHRRDRVFIVGYTERSGCSGESRGRTEKEPSNGHSELEERFMGNSASKGLSEWRQSEWTESQQEAGTGMESESERSGEDVADSNDKGMERREDTRGISCNRSEPRNKHFRRRSPDETGRAIKSELGRVLDGVSRRLDGHRWPAGQGAEQYNWEPPRVAMGVKNRVGRLKALGNAVVPLQIYPIMAGIKAIDDALGR